MDVAKLRPLSFVIWHLAFVIAGVGRFFSLFLVFPLAKRR